MKKCVVFTDLRYKFLHCIALAFLFPVTMNFTLQQMTFYFDAYIQRVFLQ